MRVEKDISQILETWKLKMIGQWHNEGLLATDRPFEQRKWGSYYPQDGVYSSITTEKLVVSNTTNFSYPSKKLIKYYGACMELFESNPELPSQKSLAEKSINTETWHNLLRNASCHVSVALGNHGLIVDSSAHPCKTLISTSQYQKTQSRLIWFRNPPFQWIWIE